MSANQSEFQTSKEEHQNTRKSRKFISSWFYKGYEVFLCRIFALKRRSSIGIDKKGNPKMSTVPQFYTAYDATHKYLEERSAARKNNNKPSCTTSMADTSRSSKQQRTSPWPVTVVISVKGSKSSQISVEQVKIQYGEYWKDNWD